MIPATESTYLASRDHHPIHVRTWLPEGEPRAVVQLVHGMAEHTGRYARFARALTQAGYAVVADDHRGHGQSVSERTPLGHTHEMDGWNAVLDDLTTVRQMIQAHWPHLPVILMGHSWGSLLVRGWVARYGEDTSPRASGPHAMALAGLIIMGTAGDPGVLGKAGVSIARAICALRGPQFRSAFLESQAIGQYNKAFAPARTDCDWLSRDTKEVNLYVHDPLCGVRCTAGFYRDLATGAVAVNSTEAFEAVPRDLPVLVTSGECDPVGGMGKGVRAVADGLAEAGVRDVSLMLYPEARHELLNEVNRAEVTEDLLAWIQDCLHLHARL